MDYWNRLGWIDPFSNKLFSDRQQWYSRHLPKGSIYTPQVIINGKYEMVGNNRMGIKTLVNNQLNINPSTTIDLTELMINKKVLNCQYLIKGSFDNCQIHFALVKKVATTHIKAGENEPLTLTNHNIVEQLISNTANEYGNQQIVLPNNFSAVEYVLVVFIQNTFSTEIMAVVQKELI